MAGASRKTLLYARLCLRLALQRERNPLEALGLKVQSRDRAEGAARGRSGRFDAPGFPVLYAAEALKTCQMEVAHHLKSQYLDRRKQVQPQVFRYQILEVPMAGRFDDLRARPLPWLQAPSPRAHAACHEYAYAAQRDGLDGLLFASSRHRGGTCVARFLPAGLRLPMEAVGAWNLTWTGKRLVLGN